MVIDYSLIVIYVLIKFLHLNLMPHKNNLLPRVRETNYILMIKILMT